MGTFIKIPLRACILAAALLIVSASCSAPQQGRKTVYSGGREHFVLITDAVPDVILEIRYFGTYNFVGSRIDGYMRPVAFLTQEAAARLREVSDEVMSQGYRLKIYDAYRPRLPLTISCAGRRMSPIR